MQKVSPKKDLNRKLSPFRFTKNDTPRWWQNYNDTKHKLPLGAYQGNIGNVLNALGALAILHDLGKRICETSNPLDILERKRWHTFPKEITNDYHRLNGKARAYYDTSVFFYLVYISG